jgi:hypothetical protein
MEMPGLLRWCPQNTSIDLLLVLWTGLEPVEGVLEGNETELLQLCGWSVASMAWLPCLKKPGEFLLGATRTQQFVAGSEIVMLRCLEGRPCTGGSRARSLRWPRN